MSYAAGYQGNAALGHELKSTGYKLVDVKETSDSLTASLTLAGEAANQYGKDIKDLTVEVAYETPTRE